jgi:hypothetical protein
MKKPKTSAIKPQEDKSESGTTIARRDATGHLTPQYERDLRDATRDKQDADARPTAFIQGPRTADELGEELGEAFVQSATSGEEAETERQDRVIPEEEGGPFVPSTAAAEFASGSDASNFEGATREPLPKTSKADS